MFSVINNASIAARLTASFTLIVVMFGAQVIYSGFVSFRMNRLHQHSVNYIMAREDSVLSFHQEFTGMRLFLRNTFLSREWRDTAGHEARLVNQQRFSATIERLFEISREYKDLVNNDRYILPEDKFERVRLITEVLGYAQTVYNRFSEDFFLPVDFDALSDVTIRYAEICMLLCSSGGDDNIHEIQRLDNTDRIVIHQLIDGIMRRSVFVSVGAMVVSVGLAAGMGFAMVKSFRRSVKAFNEKVALVTAGKFEEGLEKTSRDEISKMFVPLVNVYMSLISEINRVAKEVRHGGRGIRLDLSHFEGGYRDAALAINTLIDSVVIETKKMQVAEENSQAKSKFLAGMSHEIRTPITAILGVSEIQLQNPALPIEIEEAFAKIHDSGAMLLSIINDILDISKIESGKMDLINQKYEVSSLAIDTIHMQLAYLGSKPIEFVFNIDENVPAYFSGDELRIKQILNNILSNAFKYTDEGKVTLAVRCVYPEGDAVGVYADLVINVTDTGRGMTNAQLEALQDEYRRFHEMNDRFTQGTGLGMSIVYNLVALMDGMIKVESEVGVGTSVTVRLPQELVSNEKLGKEAAERLRKFEQGALADRKKMDFVPESMPYGSVLVVDDVEANLYVAKGLMGFFDLQIETVSGGYAAIDKVKSGRVYDIIFMDHMMPGINGMETTAVLREMGYTAPIVALTANALIGRAEEFMKAGFDGFVAKPIRTLHLSTVLTKFIRDKQPPEVLEAAKQNAPKNTAQINDEPIDDYYSRSDIADTLRKEFLRTQNNIIAEITDAVNNADFTTAHRLAHTLKGLAGLIGEDALVNLAAKAEAAFKDGNQPPPELFSALTAETNGILAKLEEHFKND